MNEPKINDYILTFETTGTTLLFEDMNCETYMPADSLSLYENGTVRAFISKKTIEEMHKIGEGSLVEKMNQVIK